MIQEMEKNNLGDLRGSGFEKVFEKETGLLIRNFWDKEEAKDMAQRVLAQRKDWKSFPDLYHYHSLGCPLYAFRCDQRQDEYFEEISRYDKLIKELFPKLEPQLKEVFDTLQYPEKIAKKKFYGGPGFVIQNQKSTHEPHYDLDESVILSKNKFPKDKVIFTLVGMIQMPAQGGRLMVWDRGPEPNDTEGSLKEYCKNHPAHYVDYQEGDLLLLDAMNLHLIEPCEGERITVVLHYLKSPLGPWEYWF